MLHGAMVLSEHPRAKVLAIHTEKARPCRAWSEFLRRPMCSRERGAGIAVPDLPIFVAVGETTCCVGDFLAMVVADTDFHARQAAKKVKVDYEVLTPVTDPFEALKPGAPLVHGPDTLRARAESGREHGVFARRCGRGAGDGGARDRSDIGRRRQSIPPFSSQRRASLCRRAKA